MTSKKRPGSQAVVDMEVPCVRCQTPLYVPVSQIQEVLASL